jgi:hypothetical protein
MNRRRWLRLAAGSGIVALVGTGASAAWLRGSLPPVEGFADTAAAMRWLAAIERDPLARSQTSWPLAQVLEHAAQSVEFSIEGYPQLRPAPFRASLGPLAFRTFSRLGRMRHDTQEPIPGAAPLRATDPRQAAQRLAQALRRFEAQPHDHVFAPHFAFGELDRADYRRAHLMHLADHAREIGRG